MRNEDAQGTVVDLTNRVYAFTSSAVDGDCAWSAAKPETSRSDAHRDPRFMGVNADLEHNAVLVREPLDDDDFVFEFSQSPIVGRFKRLGVGQLKGSEAG